MQSFQSSQSSEKQDFCHLPEIKLTTTREDKYLYEQYAELYSIIVAMEHLEKAYLHDTINVDAYTTACKKLIIQYKTLNETFNKQIDLDEFNTQYNLHCNMAINRFKIGTPITTYSNIGSNSEDKKREIHIFHTVQYFITVMDSLKLEMKSVDELHPHFSDLLESLNKIQDLPVEHIKDKVNFWFLMLDSMKASDEMPADKIRQMSMDLEIAYNAFHKFISND